MTAATRAVVDASVVVRATVSPQPEARAWTQRLGRDVRAFAPGHLWAEVANALRGYVVAGLLTRGQAHRGLAAAAGLSISLRSTRELAPAALEAALDQGLSVYDAYYLALADLLGATLVTADRRLAAAAASSDLIA